METESFWLFVSSITYIIFGIVSQNVLTQTLGLIGLLVLGLYVTGTLMSDVREAMNDE